MPTFTFEGHYRDREGGNRCDVVLAPDRDTALRMAGRAVLEDNEWCDGRLKDYDGLADFYTSEVVITAEWEDLKGIACPNCTSHSGRETGAVLARGNGAAKVLRCGTCEFEWVPLGRARDAAPIPSAAEINAELDAFEREQNEEDCDESTDRRRVDGHLSNDSRGSGRRL